MTEYMSLHNLLHVITCLLILLFVNYMNNAIEYYMYHYMLLYIILHAILHGFTTKLHGFTPARCCCGRAGRQSGEGTCAQGLSGSGRRQEAPVCGALLAQPELGLSGPAGREGAPVRWDGRGRPSHCRVAMMV